jgi:signal transduction histidine kinase
MLKVLLGVLMDNAIKYTPNGGKIGIDFTANQIAITDNGPGIADSEKEKVFGRFYRIRKNDGQGSGLGLAIAQQISRFLDIDIKLEDGSEGKGLRVLLVFKDKNTQGA